MAKIRIVGFLDFPVNEKRVGKIPADKFACRCSYPSKTYNTKLGLSYSFFLFNRECMSKLLFTRGENSEYNNTAYSWHVDTSDLRTAIDDPVIFNEQLTKHTNETQIKGVITSADRIGFNNGDALYTLKIENEYTVKLFKNEAFHEFNVYFSDIKIGALVDIVAVPYQWREYTLSGNASKKEADIAFNVVKINAWSYLAKDYSDKDIEEYFGDESDEKKDQELLKTLIDQVLPENEEKITPNMVLGTLIDDVLPENKENKEKDTPKSSVKIEENKPLSTKEYIEAINDIYEKFIKVDKELAIDIIKTINKKERDGK